MSTLQELLTDELRDLYDAEKQLTKALPKLAKASSTNELKQAFLEHAEVTKNQVARLEQVFEALGERAKSKPCKGMKGLVEEANEHLSENDRGHHLDAMLIAAAQRVEHYEIAGYGTARAYAKSMGHKQAAELLNETLKEEEMTDKLLSKVGVQVQKEVLREEGEAEEGAQEQLGRYEGEAKRYRGKVRSTGGNGSSRRGASSRSSSGRNTAQARTSGGRNTAQARSSRSTNGGSGSGRTTVVRPGKAGSRVTTDHEQIRQWAEERGAHPACVRGTGGKADTGMIRLDFPGYSGRESLQEISWDEFFQKFDDNNLALLYQESTARGQKSNFNKIIARETAEMAAKGGRGSARRGTARSR